MAYDIFSLILCFVVNSITDALNETKDKVRYLESIRKYLDQMYSTIPLSTICNTTLPGLMASIRQMDSVSRYYARSGYLGLLFAKVCGCPTLLSLPHKKSNGLMESCIKVLFSC